MKHFFKHVIRATLEVRVLEQYEYFLHSSFTHILCTTGIWYQLVYIQVYVFIDYRGITVCTEGTRTVNSIHGTYISDVYRVISNIRPVPAQVHMAVADSHKVQCTHHVHR